MSQIIRATLLRIGLPKRVEKSWRAEELDAVDLTKIAQVLVPANDIIGVCCDGVGDQEVIVWVAHGQW
jgi:hypothetical protein